MAEAMVTTLGIEDAEALRSLGPELIVGMPDDLNLNEAPSKTQLGMVCKWH